MKEIATFGLSVEQLFGQGAKAVKAAAGKVMGGNGKATRKGAGIAKYREPKTGKTWTGFGKAPGWIASARNREKFLIEQTAAVAKPEAQEAASPVEKKATRGARTVAASAKKTRRALQVAAGTPHVGGTLVATRKPVATKAPAKKIASIKKSSPVAQTGPASKVSKARAPAARKVAAKAVRPQKAARVGARAKTAVEGTVPAAAQQGVETTAFAS